MEKLKAKRRTLRRQSTIIIKEATTALEGADTVQLSALLQRLEVNNSELRKLNIEMEQCLPNDTFEHDYAESVQYDNRLQIHGQHEQRHLQYRRNLIQQLVGDVRAGAQKRGPSARNDCEERLDGGRSHFIYKLPGRSSKDCAVCKRLLTREEALELYFSLPDDPTSSDSDRDTDEDFAPELAPPDSDEQSSEAEAAESTRKPQKRKATYSRKKRTQKKVPRICDEAEVEEEEGYVHVDCNEETSEPLSEQDIVAAVRCEQTPSEVLPAETDDSDESSDEAPLPSTSDAATGLDTVARYFSVNAAGVLI
ncbi:hypothetical protein HPB50_009372 [Hyalomma asiaticum]|uniref:Uncharacterized protein n=1 Tax=Hyalomma asiaticum TaxID=266040 RepID=A0ACB7SFQ0_HYAAI|nr:hypothetical protein HPB50_009372 [Hyalomma asiaticum]